MGQNFSATIKSENVLSSTVSPKKTFSAEIDGPSGTGIPGPPGPQGPQGPPGPIGPQGLPLAIQDEGTNLTLRSYLDFVGAGVTATDDAANNRTIVTIPGGTSAVSSVFARTGAVVAVAGDYTAAQVTNAVDQTQSYANPVWITSFAWAKITSAPSFLVSPLTTKGDVHVFSTADTRLGVGIDGQVLTADSNQTTGLKWATPASGGGGAWSALTNPTANLSLSMGAFTSLFTFGAATGAGVDLFKLTDAGNNTGTGAILSIAKAAFSSAIPVRIKQLNNGDAQPLIQCENSNAAVTLDLYCADVGGGGTARIDAGGGPFLLTRNGSGNVLLKFDSNSTGKWLTTITSNFDGLTSTEVGVTINQIHTFGGSSTCALLSVQNLGTHVFDVQQAAAVVKGSAALVIEGLTSAASLATDSTGKIIAGSIGAMQTPWLQNIAGAGFNLLNAGNVGIGSSLATAPMASPGKYVQVGSDTGTTIGQVMVCSNQPTVNQVIGEVDFVNFANASAEKRVAYVQAISVGTSGNSSSLAFFTANAAAPAERLRITNTGWVGIGTPNPAHNLDVVGDCAVSQTIYAVGSVICQSNASNNSGFYCNQSGGIRWSLTKTATAEGSGNAGSDFILNRYDNTATNLGFPLFIKRSSGFIGVNGIVPAYQLDVAGDVNISTGSVYRINGVSSVAGGSVAGTLVLNPSGGNVGIGTASPSAPLNVKLGSNPDSTGQPGGTWASIIYNATNSSGYNGLLVKNNWQSTTSTLLQAGVDAVGGAFVPMFMVRGDGNVGIGTTTPQQKLAVTGVSGAQAGGGSNGIFQITTGTGANTDNMMQFGFVDGSYGWIQSLKPGTAFYSLALNPGGGNVGIGTVSPTSKLQVVGLPTYASDSAAGTGGLTSGAFYIDSSGGVHCKL